MATPKKASTRRGPGLAPEIEINLDALFASISDVVLVIDREGRYLWGAPTKVALDAESRRRNDWLMGKTILEALQEANGSTDQADMMLGALERALATGETQEVEYWVNVWGNERWFSASVSPMTEDTVVWVARDVTERVNASQLLERAVEERTQELAALAQTANAITSTLEVGALMEVLLDNLKSVIDYNGAGISMREGDYIRQLAVRRPPGYPTRPDVGPAVERIDSVGTHWKLVMAGKSFIIDDTHGPSPVARAYRKSWGGDFTGTAGEYIRCLAVVPLLARNEVTGLMTIASSEPNHFDEHHLDILRGVADIAASALENARLFEETQQGTKEMAALLEVSRSISSTLNVTALVNEILNQLRTVIDYSGASVVWINDDSVEVVESLGPGGRENDIIGARFNVDFSQGLGAAIMSEEPAIIADIHSDEPLAVSYREILGDNIQLPAYSYIRGWLGVPLAVEGRVIGMLSMSKDKPAYFNPHHAELAIAVARQAAVAAENARLFEETERRTKELSGLLEVARAAASTLDPREVITTVLDELHKIIDHTGSVILTVSDGALEIVDARAIAGYEQEIGVRIPLEPPFTGLWQTILRGEPVIIDDVRSEEPLAQDYRATITSAGMAHLPPFGVMRSWMSVPLALKDRVTGMLAISHRKPARFTSEDARLVRALADQAAVAIENARLFAETERQARQTAALLEVSAAVGSTIELAPLLELIMDQLRTVVDYEGGALHLLEDGTLKRLAWRDRGQVHGPTPSPQAGMPAIYTLGQLSALWNLLEAGPLIIDDVRDDSPAGSAYRDIWGGNVKGTAVEYVTSLLAAPLVLRGDIIGLLVLGHREKGHFQREHAELAAVVAAHAASAIENARLFEQAQHGAALEERQRLARELHDSVSQALYGIALGARTARTLIDRNPPDAIEPVDYILSLADAGLAEMRALIFELRPESLESEGLVAAIRKQVDAAEARHNILVEFRSPDEPNLPLPAKEAIYRITQESLTNIVKHSQATQVHITLASKSEDLELTIADNGIGFDPTGDFPGHLGLQSMRERAEKLGGRLEISSKPGSGTRVTATFPQ